MKKMILSIAIAAFSMTTLSVLTAQEAQAKKVYRPHKHSTVKSKHSKRYATKKHTRRNKGRYQGGNSVPNPPLASVSIYEAPIQAYEFQKPTQSHNRSQNQSQSHNRLNDNLAHDCWKPEFLFRPGCGGSEQSSGTPGRTGGGSDIR